MKATKIYVVENKQTGEIIRYNTSEKDGSRVAYEISLIFDVNPCQLRLLEIIDGDEDSITYVEL